jgi:hypothetical protein
MEKVCSFDIYLCNTADLIDNCSWLYSLILTIDANFRLKNKDRLKVTNSPALSDGLGHFVPEEPYQTYIKKYGFQEEVCHFHGLLNMKY